MTTFFGLIDFSGRPLEQASIEAMRDATRANPGDVERIWHENNLALGCNLRWVTPESQAEVLPLVRTGQGGTRVIVASARIDNRKELANKLGVSARDLNGTSDSELILGAYEKWRENCVDHLLGDFAFAVWDAPGGRVFCARDHMGIRPLFFRRMGDRLALSNSIEPLIHDAFPRPVLKLETVARYLRDGENYSATDTFFEEVFQLPPASYLVVNAAGESVKQYWSLGDVEPLRLGSIDDYCEITLELLQESVLARTRSMYPMGAHLSGGLDSSAIVASAGSLGVIDASNMTTFTWMHPPESQEALQSSEWSMAWEIATAYDLPHYYTDSTEQDMQVLLRDHDIALGDTVDLWTEKLLARNAADMGIRTMLSGWGGDQLISHYGNDVYAERAMTGELIPVLRELFRVTRRNGRIGLYPRNLYRMILRPFIRSYRSPHGPRNGGLDLNFLDYAQPRVLRALESAAPFVGYNGIYLREQQLCSSQQAHLHNRVGSWAVSGNCVGLDYLYPLLDKRVVEIAVGSPVNLFRKNDIGRYLFKRSVKDLKPEGFWVRDHKTEPYRVDRSLRLSIEASKNWAKQIPGTADSEAYIDISSLVAEINKLNYDLVERGFEFSRKIMAINRSALVLGLRRYF